MSSPKILISGSGIAGSVFAFWLLRAYPAARITIAERAPSLCLTGASVDIRSSAVDIIKRMNAEPEIRARSTKEEGIQWVRANGSPVGTIEATGRTDVQSFTSEYEIFRGELAKIFITPVLDRVKLLFNESVERFEQEDDGVQVAFSGSKERVKYDLLVAADGLGSKIRGAILNCSPREHIHDEGVHAAYFTINRDLLQGSRLAKGYISRGGRVIYLRPDPDPAGCTRALLLCVTTKSDVEMKNRLNAALRDGTESYMQLMDELFHSAGWLAPEVLQGMRESDDFYSSFFAQVRAPALQSGRVVLLGDAGYATPGLGTSLAIMGGYVLAGEMLRHPGDVRVATKKYEEIMLPFARDSQGGVVGEYAMQLLNPQSEWGIAVLHAVVRVVTGLRLHRLATAVAAALGVTDKKLNMPDYRWPEEGKV
jgi:2-polyprenyl-6-methoxyphenol hydroxylase-like FAD-dependent oxidoreductase